MKIRKCHISNSSSSSFIISLPDSAMEVVLYTCLRQKVTQPETFNRGLGDKWSVSLDEKGIHCSTTMDNYDLYSFVVNDLKVSSEHITILWRG